VFVCVRVCVRVCVSECVCACVCVCVCVREREREREKARERERENLRYPRAREGVGFANVGACVDPKSVKRDLLWGKRDLLMCGNLSTCLPRSNVDGSR
jgi:hypothetical protein